jgi:hypothetical protein
MNIFTRLFRWLFPGAPNPPITHCDCGRAVQPYERGICYVCRST